MSIKDELIGDYFDLATRLPQEKIAEIKNISANPRDVKVLLAKEIVKMYHGEKEAVKAEEEFNKVHRDKELPSEIDTFATDKNTYPVLDLLCDTRLVTSKNEAKRLVEGGAVCVRSGEEEIKIKDWREEIKIKDGMVLQAGKRKFVKIICKK